MANSFFTVEARGLEKIYGEGAARVHAVRGVDLRVRPGSVVLLMGPSGSGKSTLLSMLGCILRPTAGQLSLLGERVVWREGTLPLLRRHAIGFVFQHYNLLASLTAEENVSVMLRLQKAKNERARARALLQAVGLEHRAGFRPRDMSGGEKQRVAIARALAGDPPIILADEPTGNLDSASGRTIIQLLKDAARSRNCAVIIVTHDARVADFADEVHWFEDGRLAAAPPVLRRRQFPARARAADMMPRSRDVH